MKRYQSICLNELGSSTNTHPLSSYPRPIPPQKLLRKVLDDVLEDAELEDALKESSGERSILSDGSILGTIGEDVFGFKDAVEAALNALKHKKLSKRMLGTFSIQITEAFPELFGGADMGDGEGIVKAGRAKRGGSAKKYTEPDEDDIPGGVYLTSDSEDDAPKKKNKKGNAGDRPAPLKKSKGGGLLSYSAAHATSMTAGLTKSLKSLLKALRSFPEAEIFQFPVDANEYPEYYETIDKPMDVSSIAKSAGAYSTLGAALDDVGLIWTNAMQYNKEGSEIFNLATICQQEANFLIQEKFADYIDDSPVPVKKAKKEKKEKVKQEGIEAVAEDEDDEGDVGADGQPKVSSDVKWPQYFPRGKDPSGKPIGELQLPVRLWKTCLKQIKDHPLSGDFLAPLDWYSIPQYMDIVDRPMDLETISGLARDSKKNGMSTEDLLDDVALIWKNCMTYNSENSEVYEAAKKMAAFSKKVFADARKSYEAAVMAAKNLAKPKKVAKEDLSEEQQKMYKVCKKLWLDDRSLAFQKLDADKIPGYTDIIANPIDLSTIQNRLETYESANAFIVDILLVFDNALNFNQDGSEIAALAAALREDAVKLCAKQFPAEGQALDSTGISNVVVKKTYKTKLTKANAPEPEVVVRSLSELDESEFITTVKEALDKIFTPDDGKPQILKQIKNKIGGNTNRLTEESIKELVMYENLIAENTDGEEAVLLAEVLSGTLVRDAALAESKRALADVGGKKEGVSCGFGAAMYDVIEWGDIKFTSQFSTHDLVYPVGYKVARHMYLAAVPDAQVPKAVRGKISPVGIVDPVSGAQYESIPIELYSQIVSIDTEQGKQPAFDVCMANGTILARASNPREAWKVAINHADEIPAQLGAKLIRCRAVFNRIACADSAAPYREKPNLSAAEMKEYRKVVDAPMWLREVHTRLTNGAYDNEFDFAWDMRLIFTNAMQYNAAGSALFENAAGLLTLFDSLLCDWVYNPQDLSLDDFAVGPWRSWNRLKYFDYPDEADVCRTSGETVTADNSVQCGMCQDVYALPHAEPPMNAGTKTWKCERCFNFNIDVVKDAGKKEFSHTVEFFGGVRYAPAVSLGHGWYQALEKGQANKRLPNYYSPLGYLCENKEMVADQKVMEKDIHENLIRARTKEFDEQEEQGGLLSHKIKSSPMRNSTRMRPSSTSPGAEGDKMDVDEAAADAAVADTQEVSCGRFATYKKPAGHTFLWFGNKDDDYNLDGATEETLRKRVGTQLFREGDEVMASTRDSNKKLKGKVVALHDDGSVHVVFDDGNVEQHARVTSLRKLSNAGKASPTKLYYGLDEVAVAPTCCASLADYTSIHANFLPRTGFFGIHLAEIQKCIEGLPNAVRLPLQYQFRDAKKIYDRLLSEIHRHDEGAEKTVSAEAALAQKVQTELQYWKEQRVLGAEADKLENEEMEEDEDSGGEEDQPSIQERGVTAIHPLFTVPSVSNKTGMSTLPTEVGEQLMVVWDFLDMARPIIDDSVLALDDVFRSVFPNLAHSTMPTIAQGIFDDICLLYSNFLMREVRAMCGFDGMRSAAKGLIHVDNICVGSTNVKAGTANFLSEAHWQNIVSYKPLNSYTWPVVARSLLLVTSNELTIEESQHMVMHPMLGNAAVQQELICLMMAHPFAPQFSTRLENRGEFVLVNNDVLSDRVSINLQAVGPKQGASTSLNQVRTRCMWNSGYYQGEFYTNMQQFVHDVLHVLLTCKPEAKIEVEVAQYHTMAMIKYFRGLLKRYGFPSAESDDHVPSHLKTAFQNLQAQHHTGCYGASKSEPCGRGWCCNCEDSHANAHSCAFHVNFGFGGGIEGANVAPSVYALGFDRGVLTTNKLHGNVKENELVMPAHGSGEWRAGWYAKRMECLDKLQRSLCLLRAKEVDLWDMNEKCTVLSTFTDACMESRVMAAMMDSKMNVSSEVVLTSEPAQEPWDPKYKGHPSAFWVDREKRAHYEYHKLKAQVTWNATNTTASGVTTKSTDPTVGQIVNEEDENGESEHISDIKEEVYENVNEAFKFIGTLETFVPPAKGDAAVCHFSGLSSSHACASQWPTKWVVVPHWLAVNPAKNNFIKKASTASTEDDMDVQTTAGTGAATEVEVVGRKIVALEHVVLLVAAARLTSLKEERSIEDRVSGLVEHLTKTDAFYPKDIESKTIKMADVMASRGKSLGKDAAGWQYWLICAQHRYSKKPLGRQVVDRHERANKLDHEPCIMIRSPAGDWHYLDCGSNPDGFKRLLFIFQNSTSSREMKLRLTLVDRLAYCMMVVWRDGIFRIRNLSFLFLDKRFRGESDLFDLLADAEEKNEFDTNSSLSATGAVDTWNNRVELFQARVAEIRSLAIYSWFHRMEPDLDNNKLPTLVQNYQKMREREMHRHYSYDTMDYHPAKGYWRTDLISRVRQIQPALSASRINAEPNISEWVRYGLRCRDDLLTDDLAEQGVVPFVGKIPPAVVLDTPVLEKNLLRNVFEEPAKMLNKLQQLEKAELAADSKTPASPGTIKITLESIESAVLPTPAATHVDMEELSDGAQPKLSFFADKSFTVEVIREAEPIDDAMNVEEEKGAAGAEEEDAEEPAVDTSRTRFSVADTNYGQPYGSQVPPAPATALTYDINQQHYCGFGAMALDVYGPGNVRRANDTGYSPAANRTFRKIIEQRHMTTKGVLRIYESQKHAADFLRVSQSGISLCCNKKQTDAYGFCWQFYKGPPLDFDMINEANFQLSKAELLKLNLKKPVAFPKQERWVPPVAVITPAVTARNNGIPLQNLPRDVFPSFANTMPDVIYNVTKLDGTITKHVLPILKAEAATQVIKPQLSLSKQRQPARMLFLKGELINLVYLLANEHMHMFSPASWLHAVAAEAAAAEADPSKLQRIIRYKKSNANDIDDSAEGAPTICVPAAPATSNKRSREETDMPQPSKAIKTEPGESASSAAAATEDRSPATGTVVTIGTDDVESSVSGSDSEGDESGEENKPSDAAAIKVELTPEQQAEAGKVLKIRSLISALVKRIQAADSPAALMRCVYYVEESIPAQLRRTYNSWALPFASATYSQVAVRLFGVDRFVRYDLCRSLEATAANLPYMSFSPRTCSQPRCMSAVMCCRPMFHSGSCTHGVVCAYVTAAAPPPPNSAAPILHEGRPLRQMATRQHEIFDVSGTFFTPAQGVEMSDAKLSSMQAVFDDQQLKQRAAAEAERKEKLVQEQRANTQRVRAQNAAQRLGANNTVRRFDAATGEYEEDEFSDDERAKREREVKVKIDIEYVIPYRPTQAEMAEYYDI